MIIGAQGDGADFVIRFIEVLNPFKISGNVLAKVKLPAKSIKLCSRGIGCQLTTIDEFVILSANYGQG